jgi:sulfoxide reductase heme-binding subunit YedZ
LAVTSIKSLKKRLGKRWKPIQRLVYLAAILDVVHVMWLRKNIWELWPYLVILGVLLVIRVPFVSRAIRGARRHLEAMDNWPLLGS